MEQSIKACKRNNTRSIFIPSYIIQIWLYVDELLLRFYITAPGRINKKDQGTNSK